jgi:hypothetical protein
MGLPTQSREVIPNLIHREKLKSFIKIFQLPIDKLANTPASHFDCHEGLMGSNVELNCGTGDLSHAKKTVAEP